MIPAPTTDPPGLRVAALLGAGAVFAGPAAASRAPQPVPTPIGAGLAYRLPAAPAAVLRGDPVGRLRCRAAAGPRVAVRVELFARRRVLLLPAGIGMSPPLRRRGADVVGARCSYPVRTRTPTGVVEVAPTAHATLRDLFAVWGRRLSATRLAGFRGEGAESVRAWVDGRRWRGPVGAIPLARHAEIVVEIEGYVPPHAAFLFPPRG